MDFKNESMPAPDSPDESVSLASLSPGKRCIIVRIEDGNRGIDRRLCDLGFLPETEVQVTHRAPLGDPTSYQLRGTEICLRNSEAARVRVRIEKP